MNKRLAIITDIHGNIEGLNVILKDIENKNIDEIICLGDTIDVGCGQMAAKKLERIMKNV